MSNIWKPLTAEFDLWRAAEMRIPFWWRDDDAVCVTPALERLFGLSKSVACDVHLAVIPDGLKPDLPEFVLAHKGFHALTHGFRHISHAPVDEKKSEFFGTRNADVVQSEIARGWQIMTKAFGDRLAPVFVPPWNRFALEFNDFLGVAGYGGLSTFTPRAAKFAAGGVEQINTHVDPIDWRGSRSLADPVGIIDHTVRSLRDRRLGKTDNTEPFGFLTHHLVHDPEIWAFCEAFLLKFVAGPTDLWTAKNIEKGIK